MVNSWTHAHVSTCPWKEEVPIFVEGDSHDTISEVESFLYSISMMNVYVNVEDTRIVPA